MLDIQRPIGLDERRELFKKLHLIYGVDYTHIVKQDCLLGDWSNFEV